MKLCIAPLFSSSSGNSIFVGSDKANILIDAGLTGSKIENALKSIGKKASDIDAILVTHEHIDHIKGVGVLSRKHDIPVYANAATWEEMQKKIGDVALKNVRIFDNNDFFVKDMCIEPFSIYHDAVDPVGYSVYSAGKKVSVLTDTGKITRELADKMVGSGIVLLESNHDIEMLKTGRYPYNLKMRILSSKGHLSNSDAAKAAVAMAVRGVRGVLLGHLSRENNTDELAYSMTYELLKQNGIIPGRDIAIKVADKDKVSGMFELR